MKNLLWIGDVARSSGFGKASNHILRHLTTKWAVSVLGVNFRGDPPYPEWPTWPAAVRGGDVLGFKRLGEVLNITKPDVIVVQCNPWNVPTYREYLDMARCSKPVIGIIAVEGKNCVGRDLNSLKRVIFWNRFSCEEAIRGGMTCESGIVPLGVDLEVYKPGDRWAARQRLGLPCGENDFIVCNVNRNQTRKRIDLSIMYFADWIYGGIPIEQRCPATRKIHDAYLYLHVVPGSTITVDCDQLSEYCGVTDRVFLVAPKDPFNGAPEHGVVLGHQACNVGMSTALGEGWGLNTMEGMACGKLQIGGDYSAFGEWARGAMVLVPCSHEGVMPDVNGMVGGIPDKDGVIAALDAAYRTPALCQVYAERGLALVRRPEYRWENIAERFADEIEIGANS